MTDRRSYRKKNTQTLKKLLIELDICKESSIENYYSQVRDRKDVSVLKCKNSGVIILSRTDHIDKSYYEEKKDETYISLDERKYAVNIGLEDKIRRKSLFQNIIANKKWLDIGTGAGGILDELSNLARMTAAIEPQKNTKKHLIKLGYDVYSSIDEVDINDFDVVTLFHVFEHFKEPLDELRLIFNKIVSGGKIIIEVPHANDFLLSFLDLEAFKKFTFWSEHLILHTRLSLIRFLEEVGFKEIVIESCQRYPLANHLYWLSKNQPGGHLKWSFLRTIELDSAYSQMLAKLNKSDTLIASALKP